jgi:hypothetical protein
VAACDNVVAQSVKVARTVLGRSTKEAFLAAACAVILVIAGGCGSSGTLPVTGSVRLADGSPVANATVVFESATRPVSPSGTTDADGRFSLTAFRRHDGAPAGEYRIAVHPPLAADSSEQQPAAPFDPRYASASTSGLAFTVTRGSTTCDLVLDPSKRKRAK